MRKPCLDCGELSDQSRCQTCTRQNENLNARARGYKTQAQRARDAEVYGAQWRRLSERARKMQNHCDDCGVSGPDADLTVDHSPESHEARLAGKPITLSMISVVCRSCNARRGCALPGSKRALAVTHA